MTNSYTPRDAVLHAYAGLLYLGARIQEQLPAPLDCNEILAFAYLTRLQRHLLEHLQHMGIDDAGTTRYSSGLPVVTIEALPDGGQFAWVWHPDPGSSANAARVIDDIRLSNGSLATIIVAAPGHLEVVSRKGARHG